MRLLLERADVFNQRADFFFRKLVLPGRPLSPRAGSAAGYESVAVVHSAVLIALSILSNDIIPRCRLCTRPCLSTMKVVGI